MPVQSDVKCVIRPEHGQSEGIQLSTRTCAESFNNRFAFSSTVKSRSRVKRFLYLLLPFKAEIGRMLAKGRIDQPVFLVGCARSGTTALGRALGMHPDILYSGREAPLINFLANVAHHYEFSDVRDYVQESTRLDRDDVLSRLRTLCYETVWGENFGLELGLSCLRRTGMPPSGSRWLVKAFPDRNEHRGLTSLFPKARYIYLHRNGIDVVNSMMSFGWFSKQRFEFLCQQWSSHMNRYRYLLEDSTAVVVRFDDFLSSPGRELARIFKHLDIRGDDSPEKFAVSNVVHPLGAQDRKGDPRRMLQKRQRPFSSWCEKQRAVFKDTCGNEMERNGYEVPF